MTDTYQSLGNSHGGVHGGVRGFVLDTLRTAQSLTAAARARYSALSPTHKVLVAVAGVLVATCGVLAIVFKSYLLAALIGVAGWLRGLGWPGSLIILACVFFVSFPPLIGYSAFSLVIGMMYGFPGGWPYLAGATLVGSTCSFVVFRYLFHDYGRRLAASNAKFKALTDSMADDSFTLLWLIRLCPLPYSLSNGALSSIPSVKLSSFVFASALTTPKCLIHVFVGDRMRQLGDAKDTAAKVVDVLSIGGTMLAATVAAYLIYNRALAHYVVPANDDADGEFDIDDAAEFDIDDESALRA